ncbi:MAG: GNAT family N-acetyltransferase [Acholeplasmatales bacterium]|nr:GNAT family N-acetyltransferase [Acholeplasmatales bacterium]
MITKAKLSDLKEILDLQHLAYISEAKLFNNMNIEPLTETLDDLINEFNNGIVLKLTVDDKIIGSVRTYVKNDTAYIGKLMVHPDYQKKGYGSKLLLEIEKVCNTNRFELFTSTRSIKNIKLYESLGYKQFKIKKVDEELSFIYLEKYKSL